MESRHPTLHQDLWVASRPLKISHSIPSTSFPNPGIQNHPFLLMLSLFTCRIISSLGDVVPSEKEVGWPLGRVSLGERTSKASGEHLLVASLREVPYVSHGVLGAVSWILYRRFFKELSGPRFPLLPRHGLRLQNSASMLGPWHSAPPKAAGGAVPALKRRRMPTLQLWLQGLHGVQGLQPQATARVREGRCLKPGQVVLDPDSLGTPPTLPGGYLRRVRGLP